MAMMIIWECILLLFFIDSSASHSFQTEIRPIFIFSNFYSFTFYSLYILILVVVVVVVVSIDADNYDYQIQRLQQLYNYPHTHKRTLSHCHKQINRTFPNHHNNNNKSLVFLFFIILPPLAFFFFFLFLEREIYWRIYNQISKRFYIIYRLY